MNMTYTDYDSFLEFSSSQYDYNKHEALKEIEDLNFSGDDAELDKINYYLKLLHKPLKEMVLVFCVRAPSNSERRYRVYRKVLDRDSRGIISVVVVKYNKTIMLYFNDCQVYCGDELDYDKVFRLLLFRTIETYICIDIGHISLPMLPSKYQSLKGLKEILSNAGYKLPQR